MRAAGVYRTLRFCRQPDDHCRDEQADGDHAEHVERGQHTDEMWGDAAVMGKRAKGGADDFVFSPNNGHDSIMDFAHGADHVELDGFGFSGFSNV